MSEKIDTTRPGVKVIIPQVKLTLQDLAYLRSVEQPRHLRCSPSSKTLDKLRFLDLIAKGTIPPHPDAVKLAAKDRAEVLKKFDAAVETAKTNPNVTGYDGFGGAWREVSTIANELYRIENRLKPAEDDVLTEKGKKLLASGEVEVRVRKVGCVWRNPVNRILNLFWRWWTRKQRQAIITRLS